MAGEGIGRLTTDAMLAHQLCRERHGEVGGKLRFTVVDGGGDMIALYNEKCHRFLCLRGDGSVGDTACESDSLFHVLCCGDGQLALHSPTHNPFLRVVVGGAVDGKGAVRDYDTMPDHSEQLMDVEIRFQYGWGVVADTVRIVDLTTGKECLYL
jgi:hypothetical protein